MTLSHSLCPLSDEEAEATRDGIIAYWKTIAQRKDLIGALGELVHETEAKVTELLQQNSVASVYEAARLTVHFEYERQSAS